jgi:hypothetical protein
VIYILYYVMSSEQIVDNRRTDKSTTHSFLPLYEQLLNSKKETAKNILEVGIMIVYSVCADRLI